MFQILEIFLVRCRMTVLCAASLMFGELDPACAQIHVLPSDMKSYRIGFKAADTDHDGQISWPEFKVAVTQNVDCRHDSNANRFRSLSHSEHETVLIYEFLVKGAGSKGFLIPSEW